MTSWSVVPGRAVALLAFSLLSACTGLEGGREPLGQSERRLDPVTPCQNLDEAACAANPRCEPEYLACAAICIDDGKGGCLPCPGGFYACREKTPDPSGCTGLDETMCTATPQCEPKYATQCVMPPCPPGQVCAQSCGAKYEGCAPKPPGGACLSNCDCAPNEYCSIPPSAGCACPPNGPCPKCMPPPPSGKCTPVPNTHPTPIPGDAGHPTPNADGGWGWPTWDAGSGPSRDAGWPSWP